MGRVIQGGRGGDGGDGGSVIIGPGSGGEDGADGEDGAVGILGGNVPRLWFHAFVLSLAIFAAAAHVAGSIDRAAERCAPTALEAG